MIYALVLIIGLCIGSFMNVVIYRIPNGISTVKGRSFCPKCNRMIKWYENIPVISYIFLKGKCHGCKEKISFRYTLVELITGIGYLVIYILYPDFSKEFFFNIMFFTLLVPVVFIDYEHLLIFDRFPIMIMILGLLTLIFYKNPVNNIELLDRIIGFIFGGGFLWLLGFIGTKVLKKEAMGFGDVKLLFACGFYLGFKLIFLTLIFASFIFIVVELSKRLIMKVKEEEIPFGPYLVYGMMISLFFGNEIINWYMNLFI